MDTEKAFIVSTPPEIEWWDEGLVKGDYSSIDVPGGLKIDSSDSIITIYIQHPVALEPPQEKNMPAPKPMFLTVQEQAKLRRQRRMADLKEQQAKIRLGLEPAPPPKVKKSNLMRVLGEEAVKDPTAVETRVNREIAERLQKHLEMNEERRLTKGQIHEKLVEKQGKDAAKGIHASVYKIDSLSNGRHRFKIAKNADQMSLTGVCILHPKFNLVVVEGGEHSIKFYKKLMLNRIDWTENSAPNSVREGNKEALVSWLQAEDEKGQLKDLGLNKCVLLWQVCAGQFIQLTLLTSESRAKKNPVRFENSAVRFVKLMLRLRRPWVGRRWRLFGHLQKHGRENSRTRIPSWAENRFADWFQRFDSVENIVKF